MFFSLSTSVTDGATPELRKRIERLSASKINAAVGEAASRLTKRHFLQLPHNKRGWTPTNFWADAARATSYQTSPEGVVISISKIGARQRYEGGDIRPVNAKYLTIPVAEEAYGKTAADFGTQLKLVVIPGKGMWLAFSSFETRPQDKQKGRRQKQGPGQATSRERLQFYFKLVTGVHQEGDPDVLPENSEYLDTAAKAVEAIRE